MTSTTTATAGTDMKTTKEGGDSSENKNGNIDMIKQITLKDLNPHVICVLCRGYFIDPATMVECLHSFCKTCIVEHIKLNKHCPICDTQINKTKPYLSMRLDKALQNIVYKLVPGLHTEEMERRKKFQEKNEPTKVPKEELEKHFFFCNDKISMSLEYYDTDQKSKNNNDVSDNKMETNSDKNPNKRFLACPGTVKIQHLMKFITMKYGLNSDNFVVDVIYKGDIIPQDYTLIDVAYYYKWEKDAPMQFFYRIFKKNKVLLKRRKRKSKSEDKISDGKKPRPVELSNNKNDSNQTSDNRNNNNNKSNSGKSNNSESAKNGTPDIIGCRTVSNNVAKKSPPCLKKQDESGQKSKPVQEKKVGFKLDPLPKKATESHSEESNTKSKVKMKVKPETHNSSGEKDQESKPISPKSRSPPILKPEVITKIINSKKETINKMKTILDDNDDESSDEDDDKPPSEKKLKIDESVGNNVENHQPNNIKIKEHQPNNIKIKVSADDVKKVEPIKKVESKTILQQPELTKIPKKEVNNTKIVNHQTKKESPEHIKEEKPTKTLQDTKPSGNIIKPKLLPSPNSNKHKNTNTNLSNIVNNLAKKQLGASLNNGTTHAKNTPAGNQTPPSSILGGQTTITKKEVKNNAESVNKKVSNHVNHEKNSVKMPAADLSKSTSTTPKGIPKDTSVTVRSVSSSSPSTPSAAKVSFSNPSFKKNGSTNSMMDLIQKASNHQASLNSSNSHTPNGLTSPNSKKSSTLSDLRQFRKESASKPQQVGGSNPTHQRAPIIPSLTPRNLTFGNSKSSKNNSNSTSSNSSTSSKSSPPSSFSALSKPLPKPGEASSVATANNFLNQANQLAALSALGLGANFSAFTDEQQRALLRNIAAMGFQFPGMTGGLQPNASHQASVTQQLPSNRLKLTVSQAKNNGSSGHSGSPGTGNSGNPLQGMLPPSLASHMSPENQWKMPAYLAAAAAASGNTGGNNGLNNHHSASKYSSLSKNLNQSIRQIPNPSLLTKQASEQQQILQRAIASQVSAAAAAAANARTTSLSQ